MHRAIVSIAGTEEQNEGRGAAGTRAIGDRRLRRLPH